MAYQTVNQVWKNVENHHSVEMHQNLAMNFYQNIFEKKQHTDTN